MKTNETIRMTNQQKFIHYYEENLPETNTAQEAFQAAELFWKEKHDCDAPYSNYNSFKVAYSQSKSKKKIN